MKVQPDNRQSLLDVCLQHTGTIETLFNVMVENGFTSLMPDMVAGVEIETSASNRSKDFFKMNAIVVATLPQLDLINDFDQNDFSPNDFS